MSDKPKLRIIAGGEPVEHPQAERLSHARDCWRILADRSRSGRSREISKFGGLPWWPADREWPSCSGCGKPLAFVLQLHSDEAKGYSAGFARLFSLFYCFDCAPWWDVDGRGFLACWQPFLHNADLLAAKKCPLDAMPLQAQAVRLAPFSDKPALPDLPEMGELSPDQRALVSAGQGAYPGSKLAGWPAWLQAADRPMCRHCGGPMHFLAQVTSGQPVAVDFGHGSRLFLFECDNSCRDDAVSLIVQDD